MSINSRKLAVFSLALNVIFVLFFVGKYLYNRYPREKPSSTPPSSVDVWNKYRQSVLTLLPIDSTDIVFVGNSITEGFPLQEMYPGIHVKNRGIGGNRSNHILARIREIVEMHPRKLFLEAGVNDIWDHAPLDTLEANYQKIVAEIRTYSPKTALYVQSVFPVGDPFKGLGPQVDSFNVWLAAYCNENKVQFINVFPRLENKGYLDSTLTYDGLHLTGKGYKIWKKAIDSLVD
jgi:lysophospholipase L1-like esterase